MVYLEWLCSLGRMIGIILYTVPDLPLRHVDHSSKETDLFLRGGGVGGAHGNFSRARYAPRQHAAPALLTWTCLHTFIESANFSQQRLTHHAKGQVTLVLTYPRPPFRSPPRLLRRLHQVTVETGRAFAGPPSPSHHPSVGSFHLHHLRIGVRCNVRV